MVPSRLNAGFCSLYRMFECIGVLDYVHALETTNPRRGEGLRDCLIVQYLTVAAVGLLDAITAR